ncbi:hypothetical protein HORIV_21950 [Vreelandella olivaria]|uniref:peptide-methionine (R)-S-oxide reductase n=1 Tax=Vreelandella olivaria TaxID=390919 RepID=A0ABN5WS11_9GAMM|nr:hypothetical protein HORIV_21950 [Halomonas olivaria]
MLRHCPIFIDYFANSDGSDTMKRRQFLGLAGLTSIAGAIPGFSFGFPRLDLEAAPGLETLNLSEAEWRERLSEEAFNVLRKHGTEPAFSSPLDKRVGRGRIPLRWL